MRWGSALAWVGLGLLGLWLIRDTNAPAVVAEDYLSFLALPLGEEPTHFDISGSERARLTLWLETDTRWAQDARAFEIAYLTTRALDADGNVLEELTRWVVFRKSWAAKEEPALVPTDVTDRPGRDLLGNRIVVVELPEGSERLEVSVKPVSADHQALAIVHAAVPVATVDRFRRILGADAEREAGVAARLGPYPWDEVPQSWRESIADAHWVRIVAERSSDAPVRIRARSDRPHFEDAAAMALPLMPGAAATYNLDGQMEFEAHWTEADGVTPRIVKTQVRILGEGLPDDRDLGMVDHVALDFEEGTRAVYVSRHPDDEGPPAFLRAVTQGPDRKRSWGDPPRIERPDGSQRLAPDLIGLIHFRTDEEDPLRFEIPANHEVRVLARPILGAGPLPGLGVQVEEDGKWLDFVVRDGGEPRTVRRYAPGLPSPYERYTHQDSPATSRVSDETEWFLGSSGTPWELDLTGEDLDVAVYIKEQRAPSDVPMPAYPVDVLGETLRARYLPYARRTWRAQFPLDIERLGHEARYVRIDAQVRWAGIGSADSSGDEYQVLEFPPPFELVATRDGGGGHSRVTRSTSTITVPENGRIFVDYRIKAQQLAEPLSFDVQGRTFNPVPYSLGGSFRLEGLTPGANTISTTSKGMFLANAPGGERWRVRRVWPLLPGRRRTINIPATARGLSVKVARRRGEPGGVLRWRLRAKDGSDLPVTTGRREGLVALSETEGTAELLSRGEPAWVWVVPIQLRLEDRLDGQPAVLEVWTEDRNESVWMWASSTWARRRGAFERHWDITGVPDR